MGDLPLFVLQRMHETAAAQPRKLALVFNGAPVSYGAFWRFIEGCRRSLQPFLPDQGIALIWVDSLLECWILDLAVRSLGLDTANIRSHDQIQLFSGLDVACLITLASEAGRDGAAPPGLKHLVLSDPSKQAISIAGPLPALPEPREPGAHIGLTSGTTGLYKKVRDEFGATQGPIDEKAERYAELGDSIIQQDENSVLNIFNMSLWSAGGYSRPIFTWCLGGAVVIQQTEDLHRAFDWRGVTHTVATPFCLSQLMALPEGAFPYLPDMQLTVVSGAVSPSLARETIRRLTPRILINLSSTEAGGWARTVVRTMDDLRWYRLEPNRRVEVVDDAGAALPPGQMGRVRVALRPDNATSYLDDPATTATFFSDGWFYPGDLGVLDGAGRLALYGRTSDIVHIAGVKYPAQPWESAIQELLGCEGVYVLSGNWRTGEEQLHVFIETRRPIPDQDIAQALRASLAGFPQYHAHVVDRLPRTGTGKVRRIALAQLLHEGAFQVDPAHSY
ncbi:MAG: AMP-binding protein [Caulobacterales bacterium]